MLRKGGRDARAPGSPKAMLQSDNAGCYSRRVMKASQKLVLVGLVTIAVAAIVGLILTGSPPGPETPSKGRHGPLADQGPVVDEQILNAAQKLALLAATREEQEQARDAVRLADHEVDLAFTDALRTANEQPGPQTPEARAILDRIHQTEAEIKANQQKVKQLTAQVAAAPESDQDTLREQIQLAQAELDLKQDELADAKEDLARDGGDAHSRFQRLFEQHEAIEHASTAAQANSGAGSPPQTVFSSGSLIAKWRGWSALGEEQAQLLEAQQDALGRASALTGDHDALEQQVREEQAQKRGLAEQAASLVKTGKALAGGNSKQTATATLASLHRLADDEKNLADLDRRIQDLRELSTAYGQWSALVRVRQRASLHQMLQSLLWIVLTVLLVLLVAWSIDRLLARSKLEHKQQMTLREVTRFSVEVLAVFVVLFVVFGSPSQVSTILGLAGAGLTVALKDFIISFLGWFVLMGRHGIRVGDWVEINGVRGEVIEIGLLRTVLLETGNWTSAGHPTGRQVALLNSFAVEGYYFNFTTTGQWLWDEIQILIPWGVDPYPLIQELSSIVTKETEPNAHMAEQEWQRVTRRYGVRPFSQTPEVSVRSTNDGVEVTVRYMTRAHGRSEVRSRLNQKAVKLIHRGRSVTVTTESLPAVAGAGSGEIGPGPTPGP